MKDLGIFFSILGVTYIVSNTVGLVCKLNLALRLNNNFLISFSQGRFDAHASNIKADILSVLLVLGYKNGS